MNRRRAGAGLFAGALVLAGFAATPGCRAKPEVTFDISLPGTVSAQAAWIEVGVYQSAPCSALSPMLSGGLPAEGAAARIAFRVKDRAPALGDLPKAKYAFA